MNTDTQWTRRPKFQAMKAVIESDEGRKIAVEASEAGLSAVCALDQLIREIIVGYEAVDFNTHDAGWIIVDTTREMGYEKVGEAECESSASIAKSDLIWKKKA